MTTKYALPPLPAPYQSEYVSDYFTDYHMEAYACAAIKADRQRRSEPVDWKDGYRAAMNEAGWAVRELYVNHVHHTGVDGLLKRCQGLEQSFIRSAEAAPQPDHIPDDESTPTTKQIDY